MIIKKFNENLEFDEKLTNFGKFLVEECLNFDILYDYIDFQYLDYESEIEYLFYFNFKETSLKFISSLYDKISKCKYVNNEAILKIDKHDNYLDTEQYAISILFDMDEIDNHFNDVE